MATVQGYSDMRVFRTNKLGILGLVVYLTGANTPTTRRRPPSGGRVSQQCRAAVRRPSSPPRPTAPRISHYSGPCWPPLPPRTGSGPSPRHSQSRPPGQRRVGGCSRRRNLVTIHGTRVYPYISIHTYAHQYIHSFNLYIPMYVHTFPYVSLHSHICPDIPNNTHTYPYIPAYTNTYP